MPGVVTEPARLQAAMQLADHGYSVVFCNGKKPPYKNWQNRATTNKEAIRNLYAEYPRATNLGIRTGDGLVVIDQDGPAGAQSLDIAEGKFGALPMTVTCDTPHGQHRYYRYPRDRNLRNREAIFVGVDVRAQGGFAVCPPSQGSEGSGYVWQEGQSPMDMEPADLPPAWMTVLKDNPRKAAPQIVDTIPEGKRNSSLASIAGSMRRRGSTEDEIFPSLLVMNRNRCRPPLDESEVQKIAASIARYPTTDSELRGVKIQAADQQLIEKCSKFLRTDAGNAERYVARYCDDVLFCRPRNQWFVWDGARWLPDATSIAMSRTIVAARAIHHEVDHVPDDQRESVLKHAIKTETRARLEAMLALASVAPEIQVLPEKLDSDPWLFNVENGTVDLQKGTLRPHDPADLITKLCRMSYDPDSECPGFLAFLKEVIPDRETREFLQRVIGLALIGKQLEHTVIFFFGVGANGKSVLVSVLLELFGEYGGTCAPDLLMTKRGETHPVGLHDLLGKRLVVSTETDDGRKLAEGLVKRLSGGDLIKARPLYGNFVEFEASHTFIIQGNFLPTVRGNDPAIWRRIRVIEFPVSIPPDRQDTRIATKLKSELPGVLSWAIGGCMAWQKIGLAPPAAVTRRTDEYARESDPVRAFLVERCDFGPDFSATTAELYGGYCDWAEDKGYPIESSTAFGVRLRKMNYGFEAQKVKGARGWCGLRLKGPRFVKPDETRAEGGEL